jgi:hypothetical protein
MTSRPHNLLSRVPGVVAPTFMARRLGTSRGRNPAAWRVFRWKKGRVRTPGTPDGAIVAASTWAATVRQAHRGAEERLASWVSYAGRVITFSLAVAVVHLCVLRWIFLPVGG